MTEAMTTFLLTDAEICALPSRYAAKQLREKWEAKYDWTYTVEVEPAP